MKARELKEEKASSQTLRGHTHGTCDGDLTVIPKKVRSPHK
jgi:hypothetical protein